MGEESLSHDERAHLERGPHSVEVPRGHLLVDVVATSDGHAATIDHRVREVMAIIAQHHGDRWPGLDEWEQLLPKWFVAACAEERTIEEEERWLDWWRSLPADERAPAAEERAWSLADWLYWLQPEERQWYLWDSRVESKDHVRVQVQIVDNPVLGALTWLLCAAGANDVLASV